MKKILCLLLLLGAVVAVGAPKKPAKKYVNRYSMPIKANPDGSFAVASPNAYKHFDLQDVPDVLVPYKRQPIADPALYEGCVTEEFVYKRHDGYELKLYVDRAVSDKPTPFVVYIHGGGWTGGNVRTLAAHSRYMAMQCGITGVRITYSLGGQPGATIDVGMEDIRDALAWVQKHAKGLNINPKRYAFMGHSAGAHLSALAALTIGKACAFVGTGGPYDLTMQPAGKPARQAYFLNFEGDAGRTYSPLYNIPKRDIPAALLVCGTGDISCDYTHSVRFAEALQQAGGKVDLRVYPYYGHNLHSTGSDKANEVLHIIADFLVKALK